MSIAHLRNAVEYIRKNPREWDQSLWFCGTTACLAGHLVALDGWEPLEDEDGDEGFHIINGDQIGTVDTIACEIAGILHQEGEVLWNGANGLQTLDMLVRRLEADQAIYGGLSQPVQAYQLCFTNFYGTVVAAAHRRTSYVRIGNCTQRLDHYSHAEAVNHVRASIVGMRVQEWRNDSIMDLAAA